MLTPQEVAEQSFAKATFGGYNMTAVDDFLDRLTADYTALYNENAVLKSKLKVLAEKVEEYRSTEASMRKALLTAQKLADDMVSEAEGKKAELLAQAEADAARRLEELRRQEADEAARLTAAKNATNDYVTALKQAMAKEVDFLSHLEEISALPAKEETVTEAAHDIEATLQRIVAEEMAATQTFTPVTDFDAPEVEEEPDEMASTTDLFGTLGKENPAGDEAGVDEEAEEEKTPPAGRRRIEFIDLQFGSDYELE